MTRDEMRFTERKLELAKYMLRTIFEEELYNDLSEKDFENLDEFDAFFDERLRDYDDQIEKLTSYYESKMEISES